MARKQKIEGIEILKQNVISALEELGLSSQKKRKYLERIEKLAEKGDIERLKEIYKKIQELIKTYGTKEQRNEGGVEEKLEEVPSEFHQISGKTTKGRILKGGEEVSTTEEEVEKKSEEGEIRGKEGKGNETELKTKTSKIKGTITFDARPHIAFYAITNPRYSNLYRLRSLVLWDWLDEKDIRKKMSLNFILGTEDEVRSFFTGIEKGQFIRNLDYEIIPAPRERKLIIRVDDKYASFENELREIMRKLVGGHYGELELKRFLRAGIISRILQDDDFKWGKIQDMYGDLKISLEIPKLGVRINTKYSLDDLSKIFPGTGKTFTEHLRTKLNIWYENWGIREGEFLYAFRDNLDKYSTVNQIIERDIEIGDALEKRDIQRLPLTGIKKVQAGATHKRYLFVYALGEDIYKKYPQFYPHYIKMLQKFKNVIWDYISNYKPEALPEADFFLDFINKWKRGKEGLTYIQRYEKQTGETIDFSKLNFSQKVGENLKEILEERGLNDDQIDKIKERVGEFVSKNENFIKSFYHIDPKLREIQDAIISSIEDVKEGKMTEREALESLMPELKQFAKEYGYEIDPEDAQELWTSLYKNWEKYAEIRDQLEELTRRYDNGEIDEKTYSEGLKKFLKDKKIDIEKTWEKDIKILQEKFGDKLGNLTKSPEEAVFLKRVWKNRAFKRALPFLIIAGGIWGIFNYFKKKKDKKEEVKPPVAIVEKEGGEGQTTIRKEEVEEKFKPVYLFPNLWNEYKSARENYKQAVQSYTRGIMNFILMSSIFADEIPDIPASDMIRLKVLAEWEGKDFSKLARGYVVAKRRGITPRTLAELEYYAGIEEPDRMKIDKIASMLEKIYNMNVKMNERLLMQSYDRYKMFMRANIDIIKSQFREWQKRQTLLLKAKELQQNNAKELGMLLAIEAQRKEKEEKGEEEKRSEAGR